MDLGDPAASRIAAALVELSVESGYANLTLSALCAWAGVGEGEFRNRFADLDACFCAVYKRWRDEFALAVGQGFLTGGESWRERMRGAGEAMLTWLQEDPRRARFMSVEVLSASVQAQLLRDQAMEGFFSLIDEGRQESTAPPSLTRATAETVGGAIYNRIHTTIAAGRVEDLTDLLPEMTYNAVLPYLGAEAALEELQGRPVP